MRRVPVVLLLVTFAALLAGQSLDKLPSWAVGPATEGLRETPPAEADAWVLFDRTEYAYVGSGEVRTHRYRIVRILTEQGLSEGVYRIDLLGGKGNRVKRLKGWNCRPDGEVLKLDSDQVVTLDSDTADMITTRLSTNAVLPRVVKGSVVVFESLEVSQAPWLSLMDAPMEGNPVRRWELEQSKEEGWFTSLKQVQMRMETRNFGPWLNQADLKDAARISLRDVPALPTGEGAVPNWRDVLPAVYLRFLDPDQAKGMSADSWDGIARWEAGRFQASSPALDTPGIEKKPSLDNLRALRMWMARHIDYRQVYLTPDRGWVPDSAVEVMRKRYGDCKDMASLFVAAARGLGFEAYPVLARIVEGHVPVEAPVSPYVFNHVIVAVRLPTSFGLPAEVDTPRGRFLLVDLTEPFTPLGWLGEAHQGRRLMICFPDGALWLSVPGTAILRPGVAIRLEGRVASDGRLKGRVTLLETGNMLGLRSAFAAGTDQQRKDLISRFLELPLEGQWTIQASSDPWTLDAPQRVVLDLDFPRAMRLEGTDRVLSSFLFPGVPDPIQRPGKPRRYPVERLGQSRWTLEGDLELPVDWHVDTALGTFQEANPFRRWSWKTAIAGGHWTFSFNQERADVAFDFEHREAGVLAAKKDRSHYLGFLDDAPALKPIP